MNAEACTGTASYTEQGQKIILPNYYVPEFLPLLPVILKIILNCTKHVYVQKRKLRILISAAAMLASTWQLFKVPK